MIIDKILIVRDLEERHVEIFSSYTSYQEWLIEVAHPIKKPFLAWRFSREREREAKLERKFNLPMFSLRGAFLHNDYYIIGNILKRMKESNQSPEAAIWAVKRIANPYPTVEPLPIQLPIRVLINNGEEVGSVYNFGDYNSYIKWQQNRASIWTRFKLVKKDQAHREQELILEAKFKRPVGYFRGVFAIDHVSIIPKYHQAPTLEDLITERSHSIRAVSYEPNYNTLDLPSYNSTLV